MPLSMSAWIAPPAFTGILTGVCSDKWFNFTSDFFFSFCIALRHQRRFLSSRAFLSSHRERSFHSFNGHQMASQLAISQTKYFTYWLDFRVWLETFFQLLQHNFTIFFSLLWQRHKFNFAIFSVQDAGRSLTHDFMADGCLTAALDSRWTSSSNWNDNKEREFWWESEGFFCGFDETVLGVTTRQ